jgi:uncharacterized OB-fold protein
MEKTFRGTYLSSEDFKSGKVLFEENSPDMRYRWSAGIAISRFLKGLKEGKIIGIHCRVCDRIVTPPRAFCEVCMSPIHDYVELKPVGTVNTFTVCYIDRDANRITEPTIPVVVNIEGTRPPAGFLHLLGEVDVVKKGREVKVFARDGSEITMGTPIEAVFRPEKERKGDITDILYFRPRKGVRR